jgi:glutamine amidotransferase
VAAADPNARLNILAANGSQLRATTWGDTLSVLRRDDGVVLASEPYDDNPDWQEIPDRHLVVVRDSGVDLIPLKGSPRPSRCPITWPPTRLRRHYAETSTTA